MKNMYRLSFLIGLLVVLTSAKPKREFNNELYRPQFHFSPEKNWMGNPNGLVYYDDEYHLFYQHNPTGMDGDNLHWGHAVSKDLVRWEYLPVAIGPEEKIAENESGAVWSGCALVDNENLLGFQTDSIKTLLAFYTSNQRGQYLAYSSDKGRTWKKYAKNPLIPFHEQDDARDPKIFKHEASGKYVMVLYRKPEGKELLKGVSFYTSSDLLQWEYKSHIPGFYESPDLVELPVNRRPDEKKWVLFDGDGSYLIGSFDGEKFTPESAKMKSDWGNHYYAVQTWSNIPASDGRTIQIAWMRGGDFPGMPFNGQMTFPCELSLEKMKEGVCLVRKPIREIELLHVKQQSFIQKNIIPGLNKNLLSGVKGDCLHFKGTFDIKTSDNFGFLLRNDKSNQGAEISFNSKNKMLSCLGQQTMVEPIDGKLQLEILLDRSSVEVFVNGGKAVLSSCFIPLEGAMQVALLTTGGELFVDQLDIYTLHSVWEKEEEKK